MKVTTDATKVERDAFRQLSPTMQAKLERAVELLKEECAVANAKESPPSWLFIAAAALDNKSPNAPTRDAVLGSCAMLRAALDKSEEQLRLANERIEDLCREMALRSHST